MSDGAVAGGATITRTRELMEAPLDRDLVALNVDSGLCYGFNETAAAIWTRLSQPRSFDALVADLTRDFDVAPDACRADAARLVLELRDQGLVTISPAS